MMGMKRFAKILTVSAAILIGASIAAFGIPSSDEINVVSGDVQIDMTDTVLNVNVSSPKAIINLDSFSIDQGETVNFYGSQSEVLARVTGGEPSVISGNLYSELMLLALVNEAGIHITETGNIEARNIMLSTRDITDSNFVSSNYLFEKLSQEYQDMLLLNEGSLTITDGGFGILIAGAIENRGLITARLGTIALASGNAVKIGLSGDGRISIAITEKVASTVYDYEGNPITDQVKNTGTINADGGSIIIKAESLTNIFRNAINLEGIVKATRIEEQDGLIKLVADGDVVVNAELEASVVEVKAEKVETPRSEISIKAEEIVIEALKINLHTEAEKLHLVKPEGDIFIEQAEIIDVDGVEIVKMVEKDMGTISYLKNGDITLEAPKGDVNTSPGVLIPGNQVKLSAKKIGSYDNPVGVSANTTYINRLQGIIDISEMWGMGSTITIRGPAPSSAGSSWGAVSYDSNTHLIIEAENGTIHIGPDSAVFASDLSLIASDGIYSEGSIRATYHMELLSDGPITSIGYLEADTLYEKGASFLYGGTGIVREAYAENLDRAINIFGDKSGLIRDPDIIIIGAPGEVDYVNMIGDLTLNADRNQNGVGTIDMTTFPDSRIVGNGYNLTLHVGEDTTLGSITGVGTLYLYENGNAIQVTYTSPASEDFSVDTLVTHSYGYVKFTRDVTDSEGCHMIYSVSDLPGGLQYIRHDATTLGYDYRLANNINAVETRRWNYNSQRNTDKYEGFKPVGTWATPFTGEFAGDGHTINNLYINRARLGSVPGEVNVGLFGVTGPTVFIHDVGLINPSVRGREYVGSLIGTAGWPSSGTTVLNCYARGGSVDANDTHLGGLVGRFRGTMSHSHASVTVVGANFWTGGLVGTASGTISYSYATGNVDGGSQDSGGLAGYNSGNIINCYATGNAFAGYRAGGLIGTNDGNVYNSYSTGDADSPLAPAGGLIGENYGRVERCYSAGTAVRGTLKGGLIGLDGGGSSYLGNFWDTTNNPGLMGIGNIVDPLDPVYNEVTGLTTANMQQKNDFEASGWDFTFWRDGSGADYHTLMWQGMSNGNFIGGTSSVPYLISDVYELQYMKHELSAHYQLANDINASVTAGWNGGAGFEPVSVFEGSLDGAGNRITSLRINTNGVQHVGLFGQTIGASVSGVGLKNIDVDAYWSGGFFVQTGGLIGRAENTDISECYVTGDIYVRTSNSTAQAGGLVGHYYTKDGFSNSIERSYSEANVIADVNDSFDMYTSTAGGLVGLVGDNVLDVPGFNVGDMTIRDSYAIGDVIAGGYTPGSSVRAAVAGGLIGNANIDVPGNIYVINTYATGEVSAINTTLGSGAGGLIGSSEGTVHNSFSTGRVTTSVIAGVEYAGGLIAYNDSSGTVNNCAWYDVAGDDAVNAISHDVSAGGPIANLSSSGVPHVTGYDETDLTGGVANFYSWIHDVYDPNGLGANPWDFFPDGSQDVWIMAGYPHLTMEYSTTITNVYQLQMIAMDLNANYTIANNIDASETSQWNWDGTSYLGFDPIAREIDPVTNEPIAFTGTLNGQDYTIDNLTLNRPAENLVALFGYTHWATIENVGMNDVDVIGHTKVAALVGNRSYGWVNNCFINSGQIASHGGHAGVLFGYSWGDITNSYYDLGAVHIGRPNPEYPTEPNPYDYVNNTYITAGALYAAVYSSWMSNGKMFDIDDPDEGLGPVVSFPDGDYYTIDNIQDLEKFLAYSDESSAKFRITGPINLDDASMENFYIPYLEVDEFDGNQQLITNLTVNQGFTTQIGFFGFSERTDVKNMAIESGNIRAGYQGAGLIGGKNNGTLSDSYSNVEVFTNSWDSGGLVAHNLGLVERCYATGNVRGHDFVGGLIGVTFSDVRDCYAWGNVTGGDKLGGLIGSNWGNGVTISTSYSTGTVTTTDGSTNVGGFIGHDNPDNPLGTYVANYWDTTTSATTNGAGNFVPGAGEITGMETRLMMQQSNFAPAGTSPGEWNFAADGTQAGTGTWYMAGYPHLQMEWSPNIRNVYQLQMMALDLDSDYTLVNDIPAGVSDPQDPNYTEPWNTNIWRWDGTESRGFKPVGDNSGAFLGTLNGNNYEIQNLAIHGGGMYLGLFGGTSGATSAIDDLRITGLTITTPDDAFIGGLVAYMQDTTIDNVSISGSINAVYDLGAAAGGLVGLLWHRGSVLNSRASVEINVVGDATVGGLIGNVVHAADNEETNIINSHATGNVTALTSSEAGGLIGNVGSIGLVGPTYIVTIEGCSATGEVRGNSNVGGFIGKQDRRNSAAGDPSQIAIIESYSTGDVYGVNNVGGFIGHLKAYINGDDTIDRCFASGDVVATGDYAGGFIGNIGYSAAGGGARITDAYASGDVTGSNHVGGFVGIATRAGPVPSRLYLTNVYSSGRVTADLGSTNVGGFMGSYVNTLIIADSYWDNESSNQPQAIGAGAVPAELEGKTTRYMMTEETFSPEWNFDVPGVWMMAGYPHLQIEWSENISNVYQLQMMALDLYADYVIMNDINASETSQWNWDSGTSSYLGFAPVRSYSGTFEGDSHVISGLTINRPTENNVGLFGSTSNGAIRNIGLINPNVSGYVYVGSLVGDSDSTIENCFAEGGEVNGYGWLLPTGEGEIGGLVGYTEKDLSRSHASVSVYGYGNQTGGLVGGSNGVISESYATGNVINENYYAGGLVGFAYSDVLNSYATGNVSGDRVGGLCGGNQGTIQYSYSTGDVTSTGTGIEVGGLTGLPYGGVIDSYYDESTITDESSFTSTIGKTAHLDLLNPRWSGYQNWDFDVSGQGAGDNGIWIMAGYPHLQMEWSENISNVYQLQMMTLDKAATYTLMNDIDASQTALWNWDGTGYLGFDPIGEGGNPFSGSLNGDSHVITNIYINRSSTEYVGLFGYTDAGSQIRNVGLINASITGTAPDNRDVYAGGLVGYNRATISNSFVTGSVTGYGGYDGGFAYAGGLAGYSAANITSSYVNITGAIRAFGGDVDDGSGMGGEASAGGLIGNSYSGDLVNCAVYGTGYVEAQGGETNDPNERGGTVYVGGLVGDGNFSNIEKSYATVDVYGTGGYGQLGSDYAYIGGLVGASGGDISDSYAHGDSTATSDSWLACGGLVGGNYGTISNSYSTGTPTGIGAPPNNFKYVGGFAGQSWDGAQTNSFWDYQAAGLPQTQDTGNNGPVTGVTGENTANMMQQGTFTGWDFVGEAVNGTEDIWNIGEGETYPYLAWRYPSGACGFSGMVYQADGITALDPGVDIRLSVNNETYTDSVLTRADGSYYLLLDASNLSLNDNVLIYINDNAVNGNTLVLSDGTGGSDVDIIGDTIIARHDNAGPVTNADFANAFIPAEYPDDLLFTMDGPILDVDGNFFINQGTTFDPEADLRIGGNWTNNGEFISGQNTVTFDGTSEIRTGGITDTQDFYNVVIDGYARLEDFPIDIDGTLTINGTFDANGYDVYLAGNWNNSNTFISNGNTVIFDGSTVMSTGGTGDNQDFSNVRVTGVLELDSKITAPIDIDGNLTIDPAGTMILSGVDMYLAGNMTNNGEFTSDYNTIYFDGSTDLRTGGILDTQDFLNVTVDGTLTLYDFPVNIDGNFIINGTFNANGQDVYLGGDWNNNGTFNHGGNEVFLIDPTTPTNISGYTVFNDLTIVEPGTVVYFEPGNGFGYVDPVTGIVTNETQIIEGTWTVIGEPGNLIQLLSQDPPNQWHVLPQGPVDLKYVYIEYGVSDSQDPLIDQHNNTVTFGPGTGGNWRTSEEEDTRQSQEEYNDSGTNNIVTPPTPEPGGGAGEAGAGPVSNVGTGSNSDFVNTQGVDAGTGAGEQIEPTPGLLFVLEYIGGDNPYAQMVPDGRYITRAICFEGAVGVADIVDGVVDAENEEILGPGDEVIVEKDVTSKKSLRQRIYEAVDAMSIENKRFLISLIAVEEEAPERPLPEEDVERVDAKTREAELVEHFVPEAAPGTLAPPAQVPGMLQPELVAEPGKTLNIGPLVDRIHDSYQALILIEETRPRAEVQVEILLSDEASEDEKVNAVVRIFGIVDEIR